MTKRTRITATPPAGERDGGVAVGRESLTNGDLARATTQANAEADLANALEWATDGLAARGAVAAAMTKLHAASVVRVVTRLLREWDARDNLPPSFDHVADAIDATLARCRRTHAQALWDDVERAGGRFRVDGGTLYLGGHQPPEDARALIARLKPELIALAMKKGVVE